MWVSHEKATLSVANPYGAYLLVSSFDPKKSLSMDGYKPPAQQGKVFFNLECNFSVQHLKQGIFLDRMAMVFYARNMFVAEKSY